MQGRLPNSYETAGHAHSSSGTGHGYLLGVLKTDLKRITLTGGGGSGERHFSRLTTWEEEVVANRIGTAMGGGVCCPELC